MPLRARARARVTAEGTTYRVELTRPRKPKEGGPAWPVFSASSTGLEQALADVFAAAGVDWDVRQLARYVAHRQGHPGAW